MFVTKKNFERELELVNKSLVGLVEIVLEMSLHNLEVFDHFGDKTNGCQNNLELISNSLKDINNRLTKLENVRKTKGKK